MASNYNHTVPGTTGYDDPEGTHGPHNSRVANAVDPRVDSDRDHRGAPMQATGPAFGGASTGYNTETTHAAHNSQLPGSYDSTGTATTGQAGTENTGERVARNIKGIFAQGHVGVPRPDQTVSWAETN